MENNKPKDNTFTTDNISQSKVPNKQKYVMKYDTFCNNNLSSDINISNNWKIGETVIVVDTESEHYDKKGKIILGFSDKEPNLLKVEFKDGGKAFISKDVLSKISMFDYKD